MASESLSALQLIRQARADLAAVLANPLAVEHFPSSIAAIAAQIQLACQQSAEVALATMLLEIETPYPIRHAVDVAIVAELSLANLGQTTMQRTSVVAAALTMNIGMHALEAILAAQEGPLTAEQRAAMQTHPQIGRDQLRILGVSDALWLDCVEQHHEAPDGSGYPRKLNANQIHFEARLLGLADKYCAMLSTRSYRRQQLADAAMFTSLNSGAGSLDQKLSLLFLSTLGLYPPGAIVHLINGESAVVVRRGKLDNTPLVLALFDAKDNLLARPILRDTADFDYSVLNLLDSRVIAGQLPLASIWGQSAKE